MGWRDSFEPTILSWPEVSVHSHRFGGREFRFRSAEIGHIHFGGTLDIPFPRLIRDALLSDRLAGEHHWVPNSGWITFRIRSEADIAHAVWLLRLSYLRYALKTVSDPESMLDRYAGEMRLEERYKSLLRAFLPKLTATESRTERPA